jgi:hypothetical protein
MYGLRTIGPLLAITISLVAPAKATTTYYSGSSGETSFNIAVGGLTLMDPALTFSGTPGSTGLLNASGTGIDFLGFNDFSSLTALSFTVTSNTLTAAFSGEVVEINLPAAGIYALGIHITTTSGLGNWCVDLTTGGCNNNVAETAPATVFFGFVSDTSVTAPLYIHPLNSGPKIVFTNFEAFDPAAVPEPRTMLLVGLGLVTLLIRRKIRQPV